MIWVPHQNKMAQWEDDDPRTQWKYERLAPSQSPWR